MGNKHGKLADARQECLVDFKPTREHVTYRYDTNCIASKLGLQPGK